jgi:hypothetical protein
VEQFPQRRVQSGEREHHQHGEVVSLEEPVSQGVMGIVV